MIDATTIITAALASGTTLAGIWLKDYLIPKRSRQVLTADKSQIYIDLDKLAAQVRKEAQADHAYIAYFHNGGHYINGAKMDKYTVVGEDYHRYTSKSIKPISVNQMVNNFPYTFHSLIVRSYHHIVTAVDNAGEDKGYIQWLLSRNVKIAFHYAIKNNTTGELIGFICVESHDKNSVSAEHPNIWKYCNKAAKLLSDLKKAK